VFQQPRIHDSDLHAVGAAILRGQKGRLKKYWWSHQKFPLQLPPVEEQDQVTCQFGKLREECKETDPTKRLWNS
jgi:hypothetical protein